MDGSGFEAYARKTQKIRHLEAEEERAFAQAYSRGDEAAGERLLMAHLDYVVREARRLRGYGIPLGDLVGEGNLGLIRALQKFDVDRGVRFSTYAGYWIRAHMFRHIVKSWSMVQGGGLTSGVFFQIRRKRNRIACLTDDPAVIRHRLAEDLDIPEDAVDATLERLDHHDRSLDMPPDHESGPPQIDRLADSLDLEQTTSVKQLRGRLASEVAKVVEQLDERERAIVRERLMVSKAERATLGDLAERFALSRERIRQIESRLRPKLRRHLIRRWRSTQGELFELDLAS